MCLGTGRKNWIFIFPKDCWAYSGRLYLPATFSDPATAGGRFGRASVMGVQGNSARASLGHSLPELHSISGGFSSILVNYFWSLREWGNDGKRLRHAKDRTAHGNSCFRPGRGRPGSPRRSGSGRSTLRSHHSVPGFPARLSKDGPKRSELRQASGWPTIASTIFRTGNGVRLPFLRPVKTSTASNHSATTSGWLFVDEPRAIRIRTPTSTI